MCLPRHQHRLLQLGGWVSHTHTHTHHESLSIYFSSKVVLPKLYWRSVQQIQNLFAHLLHFSECILGSNVVLGNNYDDIWVGRINILQHWRGSPLKSNLKCGLLLAILHLQLLAWVSREELWRRFNSTGLLVDLITHFILRFLASSSS